MISSNSLNKWEVMMINLPLFFSLIIFCYFILDDDFVNKVCGKVEGERFAQDIDKIGLVPTTSCGF